MTIYRGVGGVNREIKQQYRGIGGVNREIKEQYRGVGGVNRKVLQKWNGELYNLGDTVTNITGGWALYFARTNSGTGSLSLDQSYMTMISNGIYNNGNEVEVGTVNKVDVTAFNSLTITFDTVVQGGGTGTDFYFALLNNKVVGPTTTIAKITPVKYAYVSANRAIQTITMMIDVSAITGQYYIGFESYASTDSQSTIRIRDIRLS